MVAGSHICGLRHWYKIWAFHVTSGVPSSLFVWEILRTVCMPMIRCWVWVLQSVDVVHCKKILQPNVIGLYNWQCFFIHRSVYILKWGKMSHTLLFLWTVWQFLKLVVWSTWMFLFKVILSGIVIFLALFVKPTKHWVSFEEHFLMLAPKPN